MSVFIFNKAFESGGLLFISMSIPAYNENTIATTAYNANVYNSIYNKQ